MIDLSRVIGDELNAMCDDVLQGTTDAIGNVAEKVTAELKANSPKRTGKYAKSWTHKQTEKRSGIKAGNQVIYNAKYYRLTHLMEYGHVTRSGSRAQARPHIGKAEALAEQLLPAEVERRLSG